MTGPDQLINQIIPQGRQGVSVADRKRYGGYLSEFALELRLPSFGPGRGQGNNSNQSQGAGVPIFGSPVKGKGARIAVSVTAIHRK